MSHTFNADLRAKEFQDIITLHTTIVDAVHGYKTMLERAEPEFKPVVQSLIDLHTQQANTITTMLTSRGVEPDTDGSFMVYVHDAIISIRSWFDDVDKSMIPAILDGEDKILKQYDEAIDEFLDTPQVTDVLSRQRTALSNMLRTLRSEAVIN